MKKLLYVLLAFCVLTSCSVIKQTTRSGKSFISVEVFQTISNNEALAWTSDYNVVKVECEDGFFYDGLKIRCSATMTGTYSYYTKKDNFKKTIPVYSINNPNTYLRVALSVNVFQTLGEGEALAWTRDYRVVKLLSKKDMYYDGLKVNGTYILVSSYSYENRDGDWKTVPVYIKESELKGK